jgi:hypothetical protein
MLTHCIALNHKIARAHKRVLDYAGFCSYREPQTCNMRVSFIHRKLLFFNRLENQRTRTHTHTRARMHTCGRTQVNDDQSSQMVCIS